MKDLLSDENIVIVKGDKDSCVVVMNKCDYIGKMSMMLEEGLENGVCEKSQDTTLNDLSRFQSFLYRHFKDHELYDKMRPVSNQPGQMYGTAKTHKFGSPDEVDLDHLKFRPIISQVGTYTYRASQVIGDYLKPLIEHNDYIIKNTQEFATMIKSEPPLLSNQEYVSYDVESLFTNIPIEETIDYILRQIYEKKKISPICKRSIMRKLLMKLTTEGTFMFNNEFYKQKDGCTMGGPLSVILSNIFMTMMEDEVVAPIDPEFYRRFVDDIINKRIIGQPDYLLEKLQTYHPNIRFTVEVNPKKFLDTEMTFHHGHCVTNVYRKPNKLPVSWTSQVPKRYKRNAINGDLSRALRITSDFSLEVDRIKQKFTTAKYPVRFVESVIDQFKVKEAEKEEKFLIPPFMFEIKKPFILVEIPFCESNEKTVKRLLQKINSFTDDEFEVAVKWKTRKVSSLFNLKCRNPHPSCKIYEGTCSCGVKYIGETNRNVETRWAEHNDPRKKSEPSRHLNKNIDHTFDWIILMTAPKYEQQRKNLESSWIALRKPFLNAQVESNTLHLFRNGVT